VVAVRVEAPRASLKPGSNRIDFTIEAVDPSHPGTAPLTIVEKAALVTP